ncbi:MAG: hypothetical protein IJ189_09410 [Clostridia bacterium]|nr:hypothetical protein [Clostridia bacterium]
MAVHGPYTGCDLNNLTSLCMPWREENHLLRPLFSPDAAALSLELASTAYDMQTGPWRENGWFDFSYLIDTTVLTGPAVNGETPEGTFSQPLFDAYQRQAAELVKKQSPISLLRGTLRQREASDTCKCLTMLHRMPGGRYVLAIGFMGTGKRLYDWISNFRMGREEGAHQGFLQLTQEFESRCGEIEFPQAAREMGVDKLTLTDIFAQCRLPGSRFRVWMAGHSQGGAIMQLAAFREIRRGLLRQNLIGYGFASPSVLYENPGCDLCGFPLFHIINGDDVTPRVGAEMQIGRCLVYQPDEEMRKTCYGQAWTNPLFRLALRQLAYVHDNRSCIINNVALLKVIEALPDSEAAAIMGKALGRLLPDRLLSTLGGRVDQLLRAGIRRGATAYARVTLGEALPENLLNLRMQRITALMNAFGPQPFIKALLLAMGAPHKLRGTDQTTGGVGAYQTIVTKHCDALRFYPRVGSVPRTSALPLRSRKAPRASRRQRIRRMRNQFTTR